MDVPQMPPDLDHIVTPGRRVLRIHPAAMAMPRMRGDKLRRFAASIRAARMNLVPILVNEDDEIFDGVNRAWVTSSLGIEPVTRLCDSGVDPLDLVVDLNECRRHLNGSQRALVAARLATLGRGRPAENARFRALSQEEAAKRLDVSRTQVQSAATVLRDGDPSLVRLVEDGQVAVAAAAEIAGLDPSEQRQVAEGGPVWIRDRIHRLRREAGSDGARRRPGRAKGKAPGTSGAQVRGDKAQSIADEDSGGMALEQDLERGVGAEVDGPKPSPSDEPARADGHPDPGQGEVGDFRAEEQRAEDSSGVHNDREPSGESPSRVVGAEDEDARGDGRAPGTTQGDAEPTETEERPGSAPHEPVDKAWFASIPLRDQLANPELFDADAQLWADVRTVVDELQARLAANELLRGIRDSPIWRSKLFASLATRLVRVPHPREWILCPTCQGQGRRDPRSDCGGCGGAGYEYR